MAPLISSAILEKTKEWRWIYWLILILVGFTGILFVLFTPPSSSMIENEAQADEESKTKDLKCDEKEATDRHNHSSNLHINTSASLRQRTLNVMMARSTMLFREFTDPPVLLIS